MYILQSIYSGFCRLCLAFLFSTASTQRFTHSEPGEISLTQWFSCIQINTSVLSTTARPAIQEATHRLPRFIEIEGFLAQSCLVSRVTEITRRKTNNNNNNEDNEAVVTITMKMITTMMMTTSAHHSQQQKRYVDY